MSTPWPVPVHVLTGHLGSGKTTLLRNALTRPDMAGTAVMVNELGEVGLDHLLLEQATGEPVLLDSGCVCCSIRGDLLDAFDRLDARIDTGELPAVRHIVLETTGAADPAPVLHTLLSDPHLVRRHTLAGVTTTLDAVFGLDALQTDDIAARQVALADRLVLTKADLADPAALEVAARRLNPLATLMCSRAGVADDDPFAPATRTVSAGADLRHHDHGDLATFVHEEDGARSWDEWANALEALTALRGSSLLRLKGLVRVEGLDRPVAVQAVQHMTFPPEILERWPGDAPRTRLVFIGRDLTREDVLPFLWR